jgi:hypothetical protein
MNTYPLWKNLLILFIVLFGVVYAMPNLYDKDPSIQISPAYHEVKVDESTLSHVEALLKDKSLTPKGMSLADNRLLIRFADNESQLKARDMLADGLGDNYNIALNLVAGVPGWLSGLNAAPMYLGLDLQGGVIFLLKWILNLPCASQKNVMSVICVAPCVKRMSGISRLTVFRQLMVSPRVSGSSSAMQKKGTKPRQLFVSNSVA